MKKFFNIFSSGARPNDRNDFLKIVAMLAMVADHVGGIFFPFNFGFRIIGRLALPIFALGIANGYRHTSNFPNYLKRILAIGIISQIPYTLLFPNHTLNTLFLFFSALVAIYLIDKKKYAGLIPLSLILYFIPVDYGLYGVAMIVLFYIFKDSPVRLLSSQALLISAYLMSGGIFIQAFQMLGILLVTYLPKNFIKIQIPKNFFYWFYPLHLILLLAIKMLIS